MTQDARKAADVITQKLNGLTPKVGIVLGSGLGAVADQITDAISFSYEELPGFPVSTVAGHAGCLVVGHLNGMPVACLQGRVHNYEGINNEAVKTLIRTLKLLGCEVLLSTNSSGSLHHHIGPGSLVMVSDHINFQPTNPLIGPNDEEFGPRFIGMEDTYDEQLRKNIGITAEKLGLEVSQGVYISTIGPMFETPAEIKAFRTLGADLVGMSTVPEVLVARHCGMRVAVIAAITNLAAGMSDEKLSHEGTLHYAGKASGDMIKLILGFMEHAQANGL
tara:strand:- start:2119 stop:2949 length:831 start_codon:yes stop_codon:yes gene_type:complete